MDATRLKIVEHEKDRGVVFDSKLKFEDHIPRSVKKANLFIGMIHRNFVFLDRDIQKVIHGDGKTRLSGAIVWNPHLKKQITQIGNIGELLSRS